MENNNYNKNSQTNSNNNEMNKTQISKKKKLILLFIILQIGIVFSSLSGVCAKFAAGFAFMSWQFILIYILEIFLLGVYAIIWQQIIKRMQLSIAYSSKAVSLIWALLFGALIFGEVITLNKILGVTIVIAGIIVVNVDLWKK